MDNAMRVDVVDTCLGRIHFILPHSGMKGHDLSVQIGETHAVVIEKSEFAHAAAGEYFHNVAAYATYAENRHAATFERIDGRTT